MPAHDFDLRALYDAMDQRRRERNLTWAAVAREMSGVTKPRATASSTVTGIGRRRVAEGDGVLTMLRWLGRTPESFVADVADANADRFRLPAVPAGRILRWDARALFEALDAERRERQLTWAAVAREVGGVTPAMITGLAKGGRVALPPAMRMVRWLDRPAVAFTRISDW